MSCTLKESLLSNSVEAFQINLTTKSHTLGLQLTILVLLVYIRYIEDTLCILEKFVKVISNGLVKLEVQLIAMISVNIFRQSIKFKEFYTTFI